MTNRVPGLHDVPLDLRVLAFTAGLSIVTAVVFALTSFLANERRTLVEILQESVARATPAARRHRVQSSLVVATVALSFVLLVSAGLFLRSLSALLASDPGFRPAGVLTVSIALPVEAYETRDGVRRSRSCFSIGCTLSRRCLLQRLLPTCRSKTQS